MKISYFEDTDTLYIELTSARVYETTDLNEDTILDISQNGQVLAITIEHASQRTDLKELKVSGIAA